VSVCSPACRYLRVHECIRVYVCMDVCAYVYDWAAVFMCVCVYDYTYACMYV